MGLPPLVRIPAPDPYAASMMLDGGAAGVIAPYVETLARVQSLRSAVKLRPIKGQRLRQMLHGAEVEPELQSYLANGTKDRLLIVNIESVPAVEALDDILAVPDLDDGPRWRELVKDLFGTLDVFVTDNPYVVSLLGEDYKLIKPVELIPEREQIAIDGSLVRKVMAQGEGWQEFVPNEIEDFIAVRGLDARFRREFGLQTLALETIKK